MLTKEQAIEKVNKLLALARNPSGNEHEKASAETQARKLMEDYHLTDDDLGASNKVAAFDQIVQAVKEYAVKHPQISNIDSIFGSQLLVKEVLEQAHRNLTPQNKVAMLDKMTGALKVAHFLFGKSNQTVNDLCAIVETTLKSNGIPT